MPLHEGGFTRTNVRCDCSWPDMRLIVSQRAWKDRAPKNVRRSQCRCSWTCTRPCPRAPRSKDVIGAHKADLKTQDEYGVKYLRYWVDEKNAKVFCLAEAPNAEAAIAVHREAHGLLADRITRSSRAAETLGC